MRLVDLNGVRVNPEQVVALEATLVPASPTPGLSFEQNLPSIPATRVWLLGERNYIIRMPIEEVASLLAQPPVITHVNGVPVV